MPDKANIKTDERLFMRVCASDNVSFVVPVPKKEVESITYESLVSKIREKYVETCNVYSTAAPGMPQVKSKDVEVMLLRNFDGAHVGPEVRFHEMCNLDPNPSSPTVGVVLRKDVEADASALHWRFKGRELSFETGTSKLAVPTFVASDTQGHAAAVAVTSKAAPTPKSSKKRKAETPAPATAELPDAVKEKLERIFESGECSKGDIDDIALGRLAGLPVSKGIEVLGRFAGPELADAPNKSRHLMMVIRELGSAKDKGQAAPKQTDDQSAPASKKAKTDDAKTSKSKVQASVKSAPVAADEEGKKKEAKKEEEKKQKAKKEEEAQSAKELEESKRVEAEKKQKEDEKVQKEEEKKKAREEEKTKKEEKKMAEQKAKEEEKRKKEEEKKAKEEAKRLEATKKEEEKKAKEHAAATAKAAAAAEKEKNDLDKQIKELMAKQAALSNPEAMQVDKEVKKIVNKATDMKGAAKKEEKKNDEKKVEKKADKKEVKKNEPKRQPPKAHAMPGKVSAELAKLYSKGAVAKGKIDEAALTQLASLPEKNGLQALANLSVSELEGVRNLSGFFTGIMKRVRADAGLPDYSAPKRDDSDSDSDSESESDSKSGSESESEGSESESEESEEENKSDSKEEDEESKQVAEEDEGMDDENGDSSGSDSGSDDENGCEVVEVRASNVESEIESEDDDTDNEDDGDAKKADTKAGSDDEDSDDEKDDGGLDKLISSANGAAAERSTNGGAKQQTSTSSGKKPHHTFKSSVNESAINSAFKQCVDGEGSIASKSTNNTKGGKSGSKRNLEGGTEKNSKKAKA